MNFQQMLSDLIDMGHSQADIARKCDCPRSTLNELVKGKTQEPSYVLGRKIEALHTAAIKRAKRKEKQQ